MNQVVMPCTIRMNLSQIKMSKEGLSHLKWITWLHSHSNNHRPRKAAKKTPSLMDHDRTKKRVHRAFLQSQQMIGLKDQDQDEDRSKVIAEMAKAFYIFSRSIFFNLEMADQYNLSRDKYFNYFTQIVQNIDIFLQEDQLMHTKAGFSLVPVPGYLPNSNDLEQRNADQISQTACYEVNTITREMQVIIQGDNKYPHINKSGSFSHLRSFELNDMGFSLDKISPITFDMDNPQTPADCGIKSRAPASTP